MTNIAAKETTKEAEVREAKRAFILGLMDLSWKLATAFLVPAGIGIALGKANGDSKTYGTVGIIVGMVMAFLVIIQLSRNSGVDV